MFKNTLLIGAKPATTSGRHQRTSRRARIRPRDAARHGAGRRRPLDCPSLVLPWQDVFPEGAIRRRHPRLPSGPGDQRLPLPGRLGHGAGVSIAGEPGGSSRCLPPRSAAQPEHGRRAGTGDSPAADFEGEVGNQRLPARSRWVQGFVSYGRKSFTHEAVYFV